MAPSNPQQQPQFPQHLAPLHGYRVVDFGWRVAGPFCGSIFADLGAEVIKVELPGVGDVEREPSPRREYRGLSMGFEVENRGKKSATIDLHHPLGQDLAKRLVAASHVVIENFKPGTMERWGLGYEDLAQVNPGIVMVRISAYGQTGPYREHLGEATVCSALAGHTYVNGFVDRPPLDPPFAYGDYMSGLYGAIGALVALLLRERGQEGQCVDVSMTEVLLRTTGALVTAYAAKGAVRGPRGVTDPNRIASGAYPAGDGKSVSISAPYDRYYFRILEAAGKEELIDDPRLRTTHARFANYDFAEGLVRDWIGSLPARQVADELQRRGVPAEVVNSAKEVYEDPHLREREAMVRVVARGGIELVIPGPVPRLSRTPSRVQSAAPELGADTEWVLKEVLHLSDQERQELQRQKVTQA